ncbi:MCE family protein [Hoyosella subflava]|uniref:Putative Mce family protein n=1 Tax=Hoyosella subflava (strain DSM 45089 / JCM 17490 / NBRC 109087 / DQS3-9A1) TaxID=443218 RepID=F6EN08_HOYSD|nr:MlaD family protein [Hoyosella subflava]AEF39325.1 Putative Mce family protein [Hoyosella subflava DQS3-9A1]
MKFRWGAAVVVAAFVIVALVAGLSIWQTLARPVPGRAVTYHAEFTDITGLQVGNDVTLAGVRVGKVSDLSFVRTPEGREHALVSMSITADHPLPGDVTAAVRFADMLGVRYLALTDPENAAETLEPDATIPLSQTREPVDVTELFNGFKPLFAAIEPNRLNEIAAAAIQALEGNTDALETLLVGMVDAAGVFVERSALIDTLADDLAIVLDTVVDQGSDVESAFGAVTILAERIAAQNDDVITILEDGSTTADNLAEFVSGSSFDNLDATIERAKTMTDTWIDNTDTFVALLGSLERLAASVNMIGDYGSWLTLYLCTLSIKVEGVEVDIFQLAGGGHSAVCR